MKRLIVFLMALTFTSITYAQTSNINIDQNSSVTLFEKAKICVDTIAVQTGSSFTADDYGRVNKSDCATILTPGGPGTINLPIELTDIETLPTIFTLKSAYPNPFNPSTTIHYGIPDSRKVTIIIYDILGHKVITLFNDEQEAGWYQITWNGVTQNGEYASAGLYIYKLIGGNEVKTSKITFIK